MRNTRWSPVRVVGLLAVALGGSGTLHVAAQTPGGAEPAAPTGNFFSSLKQAFQQDFEHEVVWAHFDVGTPPDTHRYYCLADPKTGKREENGVGGQPVIRRDGMTGIKSGATTFYSCANARQQGLLVSEGYVLTDAVKTALAARPPMPAPAPPAVPVPAPMPVPLPAAGGAALGSSPGGPADDARHSQVLATFARFIAGQNAHDAAAVAAVLVNSPEFVLARAADGLATGTAAAMSAFQSDWRGPWIVEPQPNATHVADIASDVVVLATPLTITQRGADGKTAARSVTWSGVLVRTSAGWRIASIFIVPAESGGTSR